MKRSTALVLAAFVLAAIALASADSQTIKTEMSVAGTDSQPKSVPGSVNRGNGAVVKPGYTFVNRGDAIDVMPVGGGFKTGTYVCPCGSSDANKKCKLVFSPRQILCKQGSCSGGRCLLVPAEPTATQ
jgi:hypothetical protein